MIARECSDHERAVKDIVSIGPNYPSNSKVGIVKVVKYFDRIRCNKDNEIQRTLYKQREFNDRQIREQKC